VLATTCGAGERGRLLYENHCLSCHDSVAHVRADHKVVSLAELGEEIARWATVLKLDWDDSETTAVLRYLNARYYHFDAPK